MRRRLTIGGDDRGRQLAVALVSSAAGCGLVVGTSLTNDSRLGAPLYWAWILTGLQVAALWAAGCRKGWAWLLGAGVQPVWITYALFTGQLGFVPGCLVSIAVQVRNFLRAGSDPSESPGSSDPLPHPVGGTAGLEHIGYACTHRR